MPGGQTQKGHFQGNKWKNVGCLFGCSFNFHLLVEWEVPAEHTRLSEKYKKINTVNVFIMTWKSGSQQEEGRV